MDSGCGFFRNSLNRRSDFLPDSGIFFKAVFKTKIKLLFILPCRLAIQNRRIGLSLKAKVHHHRRITTVINKQIRPLTIRENKSTLGTPPVLFQSLPFPGKNRNTKIGDCRGSLILGRKNIAAGPANIRPQSHQRLDQNRCFDRHMKGAHDSGPFQRFLCSVLLTQSHQSRHFLLG